MEKTTCSRCQAPQIVSYMGPERIPVLARWAESDTTICGACEDAAAAARGLRVAMRLFLPDGTARDGVWAGQANGASIAFAGVDCPSCGGPVGALPGVCLAGPLGWWRATAECAWCGVKVGELAAQWGPSRLLSDEDDAQYAAGRPLGRALLEWGMGLRRQAEMDRVPCQAPRRPWWLERRGYDEENQGG